MGLPSTIEELGRFDFLQGWLQRFSTGAESKETKQAPEESEKYCYVMIYFRTPEISELCYKRLERLSVDCLMESSYFQAYAVLPDSEAALQAVEQDPDVVHIEKCEPPSGK